MGILLNLELANGDWWWRARKVFPFELAAFREFTTTSAHTKHRMPIACGLFCVHSRQCVPASATGPSGLAAWILFPPLHTVFLPSFIDVFPATFQCQWLRPSNVLDRSSRSWFKQSFFCCRRPEAVSQPNFCSVWKILTFSSV